MKYKPKATNGNFIVVNENGRRIATVHNGVLNQFHVAEAIAKALEAAQPYVGFADAWPPVE